MSAGLLAMLDYADAMDQGTTLNVLESRRRVIGVDIDIRDHNRRAIEGHPFSHKVEMIQGSSIDPGVAQTVRERIGPHERVLVVLDSNHTHDHVLHELEHYAPLVSKGSYCVVFDTVIEDMKTASFPDRTWGVGDNPKTAVREYLRLLEEEGRSAADGSRLLLQVDREIENKLLITVAPEGYLHRPD